jgi:hypothetical protein
LEERPPFVSEGALPQLGYAFVQVVARVFFSGDEPSIACIPAKRTPGSWANSSLQSLFILRILIKPVQCSKPRKVLHQETMKPEEFNICKVTLGY